MEKLNSKEMGILRDALICKVTEARANITTRRSMLSDPDSKDFYTWQELKAEALELDCMTHKILTAIETLAEKA